MGGARRAAGKRRQTMSSSPLAASAADDSLIGQKSKPGTNPTRRSSRARRARPLTKRYRRVSDGRRETSRTTRRVRGKAAVSLLVKVLALQMRRHGLGHRLAVLTPATLVHRVRPDDHPAAVHELDGRVRLVRVRAVAEDALLHLGAGGILVLLHLRGLQSERRRL